MFKSRFVKAMTIGLFTTVALAGCKGGGLFNGKLFKERAAEKPAPSDQGVEKSFFVDAKGKPKTFLCAWAPEIGRGFYGEHLTLFANEAMHCNIEFEITENYLVGKTINPSFPNDRSRWKETLKIPIRSHYYYERQKDQHGRQTNEWVENTSRSHWSARPMMKLDLSAINIHEFLGGAGMQTTSVEEIEWDRQSNFLGFSVNTVSAYFPEFQGKFRVNFLKFEHDPTFQKTPYHQENARMINVLHVLGRKIEGVEQELYAAHWDVRNPTTIYISGAPADQQKTISDALEKWNTTLAEIGVISKGQKAFIPVIKDLQHPFDLRYPSLTWISDKRISANSPLGIGMAHTDVRNGKIIWGGVVLYGGMLETYINRYAPVEAASNAANNLVQGQSPFAQFAPIFSKNHQPIIGIDDLRATDRSQLIGNMTRDQRAHLESEISVLARAGSDPAKLQAAKDQLASLTNNSAGMNKIVADLIKQSRMETATVQDFFKRSSVAQLVGLQNPEAKMQLGAVTEERPNKGRAAVRQGPPSKMERIKELSQQTSPFFIETDRTAERMAGAWMAAAAQQTRNYPELLESVVADLALHEFGHMLGLGHQFKENILPEEGTVPSTILRDLREKADEKHEFTNYTSVMGYRNGRTEMALPAADLNPGPHDKLVLRYLYKGQYTAFDRGADQFLYAKVPQSGKIPTRSVIQTKQGQFKNLPTSYFPACNDYEASLDADPFCNRWDRGSRAEDIVAGYFQQISDNLLSRLYSLVGGGGTHWYHEYYLWYSSFDSFSRVRLFYDEMRRRLRSEDDLKPLWNDLRNDKDALFAFSQACQAENFPAGTPQVLQTLFTKRPDIRDLCRANALALREFRFFLNLPEGDYTRLDHTNRYISGGYLEGDVTRSYGGFLGSWFQLSNFPLKFVSMFTITAANPFQFWGGWLVPNMFYDHEENRGLYRTLYPREYTRLISDSVQNNMTFAATGIDNKTSLGRTILATASLLPYQRYQANDAARLPREYSDMLDQQNQFQLSMVAVILNAVKPDANSNVKADHYKKFTASIYDFFTGKSTTASEVYILPKGDVMVRANGMFIYPVTKLKFYDGTNSYAIAYSVAYDYEEGDKLVEDSVKSALLEKHNSIASICIDGFSRNGLGSYFDSSQKDFDGFYIPPGIAEEIGKEKTGLFYDSIEKAYAKYETYSQKSIPDNFPLRSMRRVCDESMRAIGQISAGAALMNGYWLGITADYMEK